MRANFAEADLKAAMGTVTCHVGMGVGYALGMAELVREHVVQRVLWADVGSVGGNHALGWSTAVDGPAGATMTVAWAARATCAETSVWATPERS